MIESELFKLPFYTIKVKNFESKKKKIEELFNIFPDKRIENQNFKTNKQLQKVGLTKSFYHIINDELQEIAQHFKKDIGIEDVWSVTYEKGDFQLPHNHGSTGLVAILYLNLKDDHPRTMYIQPWNNIFTDNTIYYNLPVKEGDIVITPKFIKRFTKPNESNDLNRVITWDMNELKN
tara:strand:- start:2271 stop:2801 length:531 start_codon:yes stop_codon:yes gene_type:complete